VVEQQTADGIARFATDYLCAEKSVVFAVGKDIRHHLDWFEPYIGNHIESRFVSADDAFDDLAKEFAAVDQVVFLEGSSSTHRGALLDFIRQQDGSKRFFRALNFSPELFRLCFQVTQTDIKGINEALISKGAETKRIRVRTKSGTDLDIALNPDFSWVSASGIFDGRHPAIFPAGEVATYSPQVNGVFVADGAVNTNFDFPFDPRIADKPVHVTIEDSRVVDTQCEDPRVLFTLRNLLVVDNGDRVGEVGFGTNIGITEFVPFVSHINERFPALHLGIGSHNQQTLPWRCPLHMDLIGGGNDIFFDDEQMYDESGLLLSSLDLDSSVAANVRVSQVDTL
jgi:hypothetical protein